MIDTHVHLDDAKYEADREEVLTRARAAGIKELVTIGTTLADSVWCAEFADKQKDVYATVGIHPEMVNEWQDSDLEKFEALGRRDKVRAIGEVGLDYHREGYDAVLQHRLFRDMIRLSRRLKLPLVIHQRDAADDTLRILSEEGGGLEGGVFHCFAGDLACAQGAIKLGFDIAVGGILTYPSAGSLREVIEQVPLERLVLETDAPWLAPQTQRGKRNEPAFMTAVAAKLAELKKVTVAEIETVTTANAKRIFRIQG